MRRSASRLRSITTTCAPVPTAICAAFEPTTPAPEDHDFRRRHARDAAQQDALAAMRTLEVIRARTWIDACGRRLRASAQGAASRRRPA